MNDKRRTAPPALWLTCAIACFALGTAAFVYLFIREITIYWVILSPVILGFYLAPAALCMKRYLRARRGRLANAVDRDETDPGRDAGPPSPPSE